MENSKPEPNVKQAVPFFKVSNLAASLEFYTKGLGFVLKNYWPDKDQMQWCWLELGHAALMLQEIRPKQVAQEKLGAGCEICFFCEDALAIYKEVTTRGLVTDEPFVGNNLWVVSLRDPDGYKIAFESPTEVPEETTYTVWIKRGDLNQH